MGWEPGFDGGYPQSFVLEMAEIDPITEQPTEHVSQFNVTAQSPFDAAFADPASRTKRFVPGEEMPVAKNITGLQPMKSYRFRLRAFNSLGSTEWTEQISTNTEDAPLNPSLDKVTEGVFDAEKGNLVFKPTMEPGQYCLLIYVRRRPDKQWRSWDCVNPSTGNVEKLPSEAMNVKLRYCHKATMTCSNETEALRKSNEIETDSFSNLNCTELFQTERM